MFVLAYYVRTIESVCACVRVRVARVSVCMRVYACACVYRSTKDQVLILIANNNGGFESGT
jgi:hypothetical protein